MEQSGVERSILPRERWWWLILSLLLVLAAWLYYRGYDASLPYIDHANEPAFNLAAQTIIDTGSARSIGFDAYPPGIISLNYLFIKYLKPADDHFSAVLPALRLLTITAWLLSVPVIALLGARLARPATGLMAAAIWVVNPWAVSYLRFAVADGYVTLFTLLSLWLALIGAAYLRHNLASTAVYSIMLAIVFKTQAIFIAPLVIALPLLNLWRVPARRREVTRRFLWNLLRFGLFLAWLFLLYPTLDADRIPFWVAPSASLSLPSPQAIWANLAPVLAAFQSIEAWLLTALFCLLLLRYRKNVNALGIALTALAALAWLIGVSLFGKQDIRHFFVLGALLALFSALGWTALLVALEEASTRAPLPAFAPHRRQFIAPAIVLLLLVVVLAPMLAESDRIAHSFTLPDRRNDLARYMDTSLEPALFVTNYDNHKTLNRQWGGYQGKNDFPRYPDNALLSDKPIEEWRRLGVEYAVMPQHHLLENPDRYYPEQTLRLKTYPVDKAFRGPDMMVLRLHPIQYPLDAQLGTIMFRGYDISEKTLSPGESIVFRPYWQAEAPTSAPLHVFNHLIDSAGEIAAQIDGIPLWDVRRSTTTWDDPEEVLLGRNFILSLPLELPSGVYSLVSGFYDPVTGQRLTAIDGSDHATISDIMVSSN